MRFRDIITEGGWASTATQGTRITPETVRRVLPIVNSFIDRFNTWATDREIAPIKMGAPLGSTAYYKQDTADTEYGDIDLQIVAPKIADMNDAQTGRQYNKWINEFVQDTNPKELNDNSFTGNPVFRVNDDRVQVDFVWTTTELAKWSQGRMTPAHGVKGTVHGSMFSSFGNIMNISIQGSGAQVKLINDEIRPYAGTRKYDRLVTLTSDIESFGIDIVTWMHRSMNIQEPLKVSDKLRSNPGLDMNSEITSQQLADVIKGAAETFELNGMYGQMNLNDIANADDFIQKFVADISAKLEKAAKSSKFDKAETPEAIAKAESTKQRLLDGIPFIKKLMQN